MTIITEAMIERAARAICVEDMRDDGWNRDQRLIDDILERAVKPDSNYLAKARACLESSDLAAEVERLTSSLKVAKQLIKEKNQLLGDWLADIHKANARIAELERAASGLAEATPTKEPDVIREVPEALPCPFCGSDDVVNWLSHDAAPNIWAMLCQTCDAEGPHDDSEAVSIAKWNNRPETSGLADPSISAREGRIAVLEELSVPTEAMLLAARAWSIGKYGKGVGNDAATGCLQAMVRARIAELSGKGE